MKSLKSPEKKLYFKILLHIVVLIVVSISFVMLIDIINTNTTKYKTEKDNIIRVYDLKIKEKDELNRILKFNLIILEAKVDSLNKVKNIIKIEYDEKIKSIYDASAIEHAVWMNTIIDELESMKK